jgi:hypothetical protein
MSAELLENSKEVWTNLEGEGDSASRERLRQVLVLKRFQPSSRPDQTDVEGRFTLADRKLPSDQGVKKLLQHEVRLAQELVDFRYARVGAVLSEVLGERPPDLEEIERLRRLGNDFETARGVLSDATWRWDYFNHVHVA